jgi:hypothetical protein
LAWAPGWPTTARGTDVTVALSGGRLLVILTDIDWPGGDPRVRPWPGL